jgi:ATP/maltotriose-dependent transcriptional regulator MalT
MRGDVEAAFELLIEALAEERSRILERGGEAFREDRLAEVDLLRSQAAVLQDLIEKIAGTQREWLDSIADQQNYVGIADETRLIAGAVPGQSTGLLGSGAQQASAGGSIREISLTMS